MARVHAETIVPCTSEDRTARCSGELRQATSVRLVSSSTDDKAVWITSTRSRQRNAAREILATRLSASWWSILAALVSYSLVCTDVPRAGLGVRAFAAQFQMVEPDVFESYGPWAYPVNQILKNETETSSSEVWAYKYDSTSTVWRALAEFYGLQSFPDCIFYKSKCSSATLSGARTFAMIDSIPDAVASQPAAYSTRSRQPPSMTLRTASNFFDQLHHYLLPQLFLAHVRRTNKATYYDALTLALRNLDLCHSFQTKPNFCSDLWMNFRRSCPPSDPECREIGLIWKHALKRVRDVEQRFPGMQVDLTVLESDKDWQACMGALITSASRLVDVSTIIRARNCSDDTQTQCETIYVDDYRYETGFVTSDGLQWFSIVATLRVVGQVYVHLRLVMLFWSCYRYQNCGERQVQAADETHWTRIRNAAHLFIRVPSQSVIYGSTFPICCYACAHFIDSPISYEITIQKFTTVLGKFDMPLRQFLYLAAVQMRNVWLLAFLVHVGMTISGFRRRNGWSSARGVRGVPEYLLCGFSCVTLLSLFRSPSFRDTRILAIYELSSNVPITREHAIRYQHSLVHAGSPRSYVSGVLLDFKFFVCLAALLLVIATLVRCASILKQWCQDIEAPTWLWPIQVRTAVPCTAGILWPLATMCVHWHRDFSTARLPTGEPNRTPVISLNQSKSTWLVHPTNEVTPNQKLSRKPTDAIAGWVSSRGDPASRSQRQIANIHTRKAEADAIVAFMNLVAMSDPMVFLFLKVVGTDEELGYYQSLRHPNQVVLLPRGIVDAGSDYTSDLRLLQSIKTSSLEWPELVHCG